MTEAISPIPRILLQLTFRTKERIKDLPYYQGALWNALFRELVREYAAIKQPLAEIRFCVHPIELGRVVYSANEAVNLGISFPSEYAEQILLMLNKFNTIALNTGKFNPKSLMLEKVICRISGSDKIISLTNDLIEKEVLELMELDKFQMIFHAPLRLKSPIQYKIETKNRYIGEDFFLSEQYKPLTCLFDDIGIKSADIGIDTDSDYKTNNTNEIKISSSSIIWHDCKYGFETTTIGGLIGRIEIAGSPTFEQAQAVVKHQYIGIGKNRTFGFGFYHIPEIRKNRQVLPLSRGLSLFDKAFSVSSLQNALDNLPNSSPGKDGLVPEELKKAGSPFLTTLSKSILSESLLSHSITAQSASEKKAYQQRDTAYQQGDIIKYRKEKKSGGYRILNVFNASDRVVHRAAADVLLPVTEKLLSDSTFAYRRGLNRQGAAKAVADAFKDGYTHGIKADITAFFESVDIDRLYQTLITLFPFDPLPQFILYLLKNSQEQGINGLPQGSPLSPVLSNLYLDQFDKEMEKLDFRLIRYGDDFVVLFKPDTSEQFCIDKISLALKKLGLSINPNKTITINSSTPFNFLGYEIVSTKYDSADKDESEKEKEKWLPVFKEEWVTGNPVYLTSICRGAYSSGSHLVINSEKESDKVKESEKIEESGRVDAKDETETQEIPWNRISRIVVVGRAGFSSGIAYRAVKEDIPVTFIDIMGRESGNLISTTAASGTFDAVNRYSMDIQEFLVNNQEFCLEFAREIIAAKIHNSNILMKRNKINDEQMKIMEEKALQADSVEQLRGFEGNAARVYFQSFRKFAAPFEFEKRVFHPPDNPVNAMLSFGYTLLYNRIGAALRIKGLNPYKGFFHRTHGRHCALASDLMEELRHVIDRVVLSLIHLKEVKPEDFTIVDNGNEKFCRMNGEAFRKFIRRYETVMAAYFKYSSEERISYNAYLDEMINKLIRAIKLKVPYTGLRIR